MKTEENQSLISSEPLAGKETIVMDMPEIHGQGQGPLRRFGRPGPRAPGWQDRKRRVRPPQLSPGVMRALLRPSRHGLVEGYLRGFLSTFIETSTCLLMVRNK